MFSLENILSGGKNAPTILLKLSQPNGIPTVWHTLILREFSTFPLAPLLSVDNFLERLFQSRPVCKELDPKAQLQCKFVISINKNCESLYILHYMLWTH